MEKCECCGKKLRQLSYDWKGRKYHKNCFRDLKADYELKENLKRKFKHIPNIEEYIRNVFDTG